MKKACWVENGLQNLILIILYSVIICNPMVANAGSIGEKAPLFTLKDLSGTDMSLENMRGKVVFINFWATWCTHCKIELKLLDALQKKHGDINVIAVSIDKSRSNVDAFLRKYPIEIPILLDQEGLVVSSFKGKAMPASFILDKEGVIKFVHFGFNEEKDPVLWEKEINELMGGKI